MNHESIAAESDPPWSPSNFRELAKARRERIAQAGQRQAEKLTALQAKQINAEQIEALEQVVESEPTPTLPEHRPLPVIRGDVSRIVVIQRVVAHYFGISRAEL